MRLFLLVFALLTLNATYSEAQELDVFDDFEGNGTISTWVGDDCNININKDNPFQEDNNPSNKVLEYSDEGGQYANVRFETDQNFDLSVRNVFLLKLYVPTNTLSGNQNNQISLKLQDGKLSDPWTTQSEIIKPIVLDQWQTIKFDFKYDTYINLNSGSLPPTLRTDFNRVVIQVNGENNTDMVLAYIDDVNYEENSTVSPVYDYLVWSDEFENDGPIDNEKWFHQTQLPQGGSWFNGEIQHYTDRTNNSFVEDGFLKIVAKKESFTDQGVNKQYTSARLNSKYAFTYGKIEIRAKLPTGVGTWPAIWMLGQNIDEDGGYWDIEGYDDTPWPACGEIDIMEHWGDNQNFVQSAMHTPSSFGNTSDKGGRLVPTASTEFHVYAMEWSEERMVFSVDDIVHYTYAPSEKNSATWPFDAPQYLLLNFAIQPFINPSFSEDAMEIDYVRVYEESPLSTFTSTQETSSFVYPNPVVNELTIEVENTADQDVLLTIYSIGGDLIQSRNSKITDQSISLNNLSLLRSGMYVLNFRVNNLSRNIKFVKE